MNTGPASSSARATASHGSIFLLRRFGPAAACSFSFFFPALGFLFSPGPLLRSLFLFLLFFLFFSFVFFLLFFCFLVEPSLVEPKSKKAKTKKQSKKAKRQKSTKAKTE
jgi:hypothetical protein